jgi:hAT family C-terminal dimerisation region
MKANCRDVWQQEYSHLAEKEDPTLNQTPFEIWRYQARQQLLKGDEFARYVGGTDGNGGATPLIKDFDPIAWWSKETLLSIRKWALDTLSCPATSCECGRVFSSTKKLITPERNTLGDDLIEALECLKAWWDNGLVKRE